MFKLIDSFSGSRFELINKNGKLFLKKSYSKPTQRDILSLKKQNNFKNLKFKKFSIKSPKIEKKKLNNFAKKKNIIMNYFEGVSGSKILIHSDNETCYLISKFITNYLMINFKNAKWQYVDSAIILNKAKDTVKKTKIKKLNIIGLNILKKLKKDIGKKILWSKSQCHGDLTLSNIILNKNKNSVILVDFLETYNDGIVQDLAKLVQEFYLGWSSRYLNDVHKLRSNIVYKKIWSKTKIPLFNQKIKDVIFYEALITLLRIFPYIKKTDKITIDWAIKSYYKLINNKFKFFS